MHFNQPPNLRQAPPEESEVTHALRTARAYRDNNRLLRKLLCEQETRHRAELQEVHTRHQDEIEFLVR